MPISRQIDVYLLPALAEPGDLAGKTVVVVDVLRATTTIIHALAAGATQVVPCLEVEEARSTAASLASNAGTPIEVVLGGERGGKQIPGFDLGNSPLEYDSERVAGKTVVLTTTNGTRALTRCRSAARVLLGAFVNFSAVCRELGDDEQIALVCAGTDGQVTREDTLFAGAVVDDLSQGEGATLNDQAEIASDAWRACVKNLTQQPLSQRLRNSQGGRNLIEIGQENDIDLAAQLDRFDLVPRLDLENWCITLPQPRAADGGPAESP